MGRRYSTLRHSTASGMGVLPVLTIRFGPRTAAATFSRARWPIGQCYDGPLLLETDLRDHRGSDAV
jgi:hypothetical protein